MNIVDIVSIVVMISITACWMYIDKQFTKWEKINKKKNEKTQKYN